MKYTMAIIICLLVYNNILLSQEQHNYNSVWYNLTVSKKINSKWVLKNELHLRRTYYWKKWEQIIVRPSITLAINDQIDFMLGYSWFTNYHFSTFSTPIDATEHQVFQRIFFKQPFKKISLKHEVRIEERFKDKLIEIIPYAYQKKGVKYSTRLRYRLNAAIPLFKIKEKNPVQFVGYMEFSLNVKNLRPNQFNQSRFYLATLINMNKSLQVKSGFLNLYAPVGNGFKSNYIWETSLKFQLL